MSAIRAQLISLGLTTPLNRGLAFGGATALALYLIKPTSMFLEDGTMKPWNLIDESDDATSFPLFLAAGAAAAVGYFLL